MHFFKWAGLCLIALCGLLAGRLFAAYEERKCRQAEGFLALLRHIRMQIDCFSLPVGRILAALDDRVREDCGCPAGSADMAALLDGTRLLLPEEGRELLLSFARDLGGSYREEQLRCCDYYIERLAPLCTGLRAELPKRVRLARVLPAAVSAALILMLI